MLELRICSHLKPQRSLPVHQGRGHPHFPKNLARSHAGDPKKWRCSAVTASSHHHPHDEECLNFITIITTVNLNLHMALAMKIESHTVILTTMIIGGPC